MFKKRFLAAIALFGMTGLSFAGITNPANVNPVAKTAVYACTGGDTETFSNLGSSASSYATRTWTGDNGVAWEATDARTDQDLNGDAIALRNGHLTNTTAVAGGIGTLTFNYARVFSGNSTLKVYVNGVQYGGDITVSEDTATTFSQVINVTGDVTVELVNSTNRVIVDDLSWDCFSPEGAELQLADACGNNADCGALSVDFGSIPDGQFQDAVFTIKNSGNTALSVSSLTLSNSTDFSVVSPSGIFSVPASGSAIVLVRFESTTGGGVKTSDLTIASNDADEASCVVSLTGISLAACTAPDASSAVATISNIGANDADVAVSGITADGYLAIISTSSTLSAAPADASGYAVNDAIGGGYVAYTGTDASFTIEGLEEATQYYVFVYGFNNTACTGGPVYATTSADNNFTTKTAPCIGGDETFSNLGTPQSSYATRTWTGDNGLAWEATDARTDQELNGAAIAVRTGHITNTTAATGGIGTLSFNYKRIFTGNSTLQVYVNGIQYGSDITVADTTATAYSYDIELDTTAVTIKLVNSGNRIIVDDIAWDCYSVPANQELQLTDNNGVNKSCGDFTLDFGENAANTDKDVTFNIKNKGLTALSISSLVLSDTANYSIVSPTGAFVVDTLAVQPVVIRFNSGVEGSYPATLTVNSDDADEASCVINLTSNVLEYCSAPATSGSITLSNETEESVDVTVSSTTADGYIAIITSEGGDFDVPADGTTYAVNDTLGDATVVYVGSGNTFTISGLDSETSYDIYVYPYNTVECLEGPTYAAEPYVSNFSTTGTPCVGGSETFSNMGSSQSNYATRTWTGDNGIVWQATDARTDQDLNGNAICVRNGSLSTVTTITGGIGTLTFNYARVFSNNSTLKVFVNGTQYGSDITVSSTTPTLATITVNVSADATIQIQNSGNRTLVDDIAWDCYAGSSARMAAPATATQADAFSSETILYPNPNKGEFMVELANANQTADVAVYDVTGKLVLARKVKGSESINLNGTAKGVYNVTITSGTKVTTKKVVVE